jgi:hypothetical protein
MALVWEPADIGLVAGVLGCIRTAAGALATSMYSSIYATEYAKYLPRYVTPAATDAGLPASSLPALFAGISSGTFDTVPGIDSGIIAAIDGPIKHANSMSFRTVFLCTIPFSVILIVAAVFYCPNVEDYLTDEVARKLQNSSAQPRVQQKEGDAESQTA